MVQDFVNYNFQKKNAMREFFFSRLYFNKKKIKKCFGVFFSQKKYRDDTWLHIFCCGLVFAVEIVCIFQIAYSVKLCRTFLFDNLSSAL